MTGSLTLISNPGSASRKYALFHAASERASLHFEWKGATVACTLRMGDTVRDIDVDMQDIQQAPREVTRILASEGILKEGEMIGQIGLRIVAPGSYFLAHRRIDEEFERKLGEAEARAPIHIGASKQELLRLKEQFGNIPIVGVSDSAFHAGKPAYAWNYGLPIDDADTYEVKRYGYHGLSMASVVRQLKAQGTLPEKVIACHLGSGASVTALKGGESIDTTMGYSPLEGVIMCTRSGSIDLIAAHTLKRALNLDDAGIEAYLNKKSGLLGLGGSADVRELLEREEADDQRAELALATYVYALRKAIGGMAAALGGVDMLVFAGTIGERSAPVRERVAENLQYLGFTLDRHANEQCDSPRSPESLYTQASKPVVVVSVDEAAEMAREVMLQLAHD